MTSANTTQEDFWFRNDDGSLTAATYMGSQNDNQYLAGITFRIRIIAEENNSKNDPWAFQLGAQKNGTGGYTLVTTTRTDGIQYTNDANSIADGSTINTADFDLTWTGTPVDGEYDDAQTTAGTGTIQLNGQYTELEFCVQLVAGSLTSGDYFDLQVLDTAGGALDGYNQTPRVYFAPTQTISMGAVTLTASPQALTASTTGGVVTIPMSEATLASAAQALSVDAPITISITEVTLTASPQSLTVLSTVSVPMSEITLTGSAETLTLALGEATVTMVEATLASAAQILAVLAGEVTISLSAATLASSAETLTLSLATIVVFTEASLAGSAETLVVVAGEVTIPLSAITLSGSPEALVVFLATIISMSEITLTGSPQTATVSVEGVGLPSFRATARGVLRGVGRGV